MYLPLLQHNSKIHAVQKLLPFCTWHCPCDQSPLSFIGFISISDVQSIFVFHFVQSRSISHKQENTETTLGWPGNLWFNNWPFFPPQEDFCLTGSAAKGHHSLFLPHPGQFIFPFSPSFSSSSCREQMPKSTPQAPSRNFQERKYCCGLKAVFFFFLMLIFKMLQQSRAVVAAVLISGWQSQGSDAAGSRQRRASRGMDFWNRNSSYRSSKYCQLFSPPGDTSPWEV